MLRVPMAKAMTEEDRQGVHAFMQSTYSEEVVAGHWLKFIASLQLPEAEDVARPNTVLTPAQEQEQKLVQTYFKNVLRAK